MMFNFLPGKKLYQQPSFDDFDATKSKFILSFYPPTCDTLEKRWDFIIQAFLAIEALQFKTSFQIFMSGRKALDASTFKLSLEDFLSFLECFYFCISTQDTKFSIKPEQKLKLLKSLNEISSGRICEPGIVTRLHEMMSDLRTDSQWIPTELYRQRQSHLQMLGDNYNQSAGIKVGYSIHTHLRMQKLASRLSLGLVSKNIMKDIYLNFEMKKGIDKFFEQNYILQFKAYERSCIDGLLAELWKTYQEHYAHRLEVTDGKIYFLDQVQMVHGKAQVTKCANSLIFDEFLKAYFGDKVNYTDFYHFDDDLQQTLVAEPELKTAFRVALTEKMKIEGYLIDLNAPVNSEEIQILGLSKTSSLDLKKLLKEKDEDNFGHKLKNYMFLLELIPELIVLFIKNDPELWYSIPKRVLNQELIEKLIFFIDNHYHKKFDVIIKQIAKLNQEYLKHFKNIDVSGYYRIALVSQNKSWFSLRYGHAEEKLIQPLDVSPVAYQRFNAALMRLDYPADSGKFLEWKHKHLTSVMQKGDVGLLQEALRFSHNLYDAMLLFQNKILVKDCRFSSLSSIYEQYLKTLDLLKKHHSMLGTMMLKTTVFSIMWGLIILKWTLTSFILNLIILSPTLSFVLGGFGLLSTLMFWLNGSHEDKFLRNVNSLILTYGSDMISAVLCGLNSAFVNILPFLIAKLSQLTSYPLDESNLKLYAIQGLRYFYNLEYDTIISLVQEGILFAHAFCSWSKEVFDLLSSWIMRIRLTFWAKDQESSFTKLEHYIYELESANDPFLNKKADLLLDIWIGMQRSLASGDALETLMEKPYLVNWQGKLQNLSFNQAKEIKKESSSRRFWFYQSGPEKMPQSLIPAQP